MSHESIIHRLHSSSSWTEAASESLMSYASGQVLSLRRGAGMAVIGNWHLPKWVPRPLSIFLYCFSAFLSHHFLSVSFPLTLLLFLPLLFLSFSLPPAIVPFLILSHTAPIPFILSLPDFMSFCLPPSPSFPCLLKPWALSPESWKKPAESHLLAAIRSILHIPKKELGSLPWAVCTPGDHRYPCAKGS